MRWGHQQQKLVVIVVVISYANLVPTHNVSACRAAIDSGVALAPTSVANSLLAAVDCNRIHCYCDRRIITPPTSSPIYTHLLLISFHLHYSTRYEQFHFTISAV